MESATSMPEGTIKAGFVIKKASNGVPRWMPTRSVELNGFRLLTVDYVAKRIGKPIKLYVREYKDVWAKKNDWTKRVDETHFTATFTPNGDALRETTKLSGWLKTQKPEIKKGSRFSIDGPVYGKNVTDFIGDGMAADSTGLMSLNFMNQEVFVKA